MDFSVHHPLIWKYISDFMWFYNSFHLMMFAIWSSGESSSVRLNLENQFNLWVLTFRTYLIQDLPSLKFGYIFHQLNPALTWSSYLYENLKDWIKKLHTVKNLREMVFFCARKKYHDLEFIAKISDKLAIRFLRLSNQFMHLFKTSSTFLLFWNDVLSTPEL